MRALCGNALWPICSSQCVKPVLLAISACAVVRGVDSVDADFATLICPLQPEAPEAHVCDNSGQFNNGAWQNMANVLHTPELRNDHPHQKGIQNHRGKLHLLGTQRWKYTKIAHPTLMRATWATWWHVSLGAVILQTNRWRVYTLHIQPHSTSFNIILLANWPGRWSSTCQTLDPIVGLCKRQRPRHT